MPAEPGDLALLAFHVIGQAGDLAVPDEVPVDVGPPLLRGDVHEGELGLRGVLGVHQSHEIGDPVDVGVHAHRRYPHGVGADACGGLPAHHRELHHLVGVAGDLAPVLVPEHDAALHYRLRLLLGEPGRPDQLRHFVHVSGGDGIDGIVLAEQVVRCLAGVVVPGALREYRGDEDVERVRGPLGVQALRVPAREASVEVLAGEDVEYRANLF